jgi:hypothetical protein
MNTDNPLVALAYVGGVVLGLPTVTLIIKATAFVTRSTSKLDAIAEKQHQMAEGDKAFADELKAFRHEQRTVAQGVELSLTLLENDVNVLQAKAGIPERRFPERRQSRNGA